MAISPSLSFVSSNRLSQLCYSDLKYKHTRLDFPKPHRTKSHHLSIIKSALNSKTSSSINGNGSTEPARILLEKLFDQTPGFNLVNLESDLQTSLAVLKKREENLQDAERKILSEYNEISLATKDLERREEEILAARLKQEKLEDELRLANLDLASQASEIGDLKLCLNERDKEISVLQSTLLAKEGEINDSKGELSRKIEKVVIVELELKSKSTVLDEANKIVEKQKIELGRLESEIRKKEEEIEVSIALRKSESEKLKAVENNLEKQAMDWLVAREELKRLADETCKKFVEANETREEFGRVRELLSDIRSELVSSRKALASSRERMGGQDKVLEERVNELEEQRTNVFSYMASLKDAEVEIESERVELRLAETRNKELERVLSAEKEIVDELQKELDKERLSLKQAIQEISILQEKIDSRTAEFEESQRLLKGKESELVEARLEIESLKSEQSSLQHVLEEKDSELSDVKIMLEEVNKEIFELKGILSKKEDELVLSMSVVKGTYEHVQTTDHEQSNTKLKFTDEAYYALSPIYQENESCKWQIKQLEAELNLTRECLRAKEMEILAAHKDTIIKDEELRMALGKLDAREAEITELKNEMTREKGDSRKPYALAHETMEDYYDDLDLCEDGGPEGRVNTNDDECYTQVEPEVSRLLALTEQLVKEANIVGDLNR